MNMQLYYHPDLAIDTLDLTEEESVHLKVLRLQVGDQFFITDGKGTFSKVGSLSELYGSYASSEAHGGVVKSGDVRAMTKGTVSLAIHGTGSGVDMGIAFGAFKITPM